jgi:hypothetical protein
MLKEYLKYFITGAIVLYVTVYTPIVLLVYLLNIERNPILLLSLIPS